jgi:hypothetical protein
VYDPPEGARGSVARYLGLLASTLGRHDEAAAHFDQAIAMNTQMGARLWLARTQHDYGQLLLTRNRSSGRQRAHELIDAAIATYRESGMDKWAANASRLNRHRRSRRTAK